MDVSVKMHHNGWRYEKLPIAGDFLSSYTKVEAGLQPLNNLLPRQFFIPRVVCCPLFNLVLCKSFR